MMRPKFNTTFTESTLDRSKTPTHYFAIIDGQKVRVRIRLNSKTLEALRELAAVESWDEFKALCATNA